MNPGGSVKDRAALGVINQIETSGQVKENATIVEGTAGNTGIGLAHVCRAKNYKCVIFMPDNQSKGKVDLLRFLGAEVFPVPVVPYEDPANYNHQASEYAKKNKNCFWTNQFDNLANKNIHYKTTGPEILDQLKDISGFVCATGTGGTLAGITQFLKESKPQISCFAADPPGSIIHSYIQSKGKSPKREGSSITEGIGQGRVTNNLGGAIDLLDGSFYISDEESLNMTYELLDKEGLFVGVSTGLNVCASIKLSKILGKGKKSTNIDKKVVTILCDGAGLYQDRIFSTKIRLGINWLKSKGLYHSISENLKKYCVLP